MYSESLALMLVKKKIYLYRKRDEERKFIKTAHIAERNDETEKTRRSLQIKIKLK